MLPLAHHCKKDRYSDGKLTSTRTSTTAYDSAATTNDSGFLLLNNGAVGHATLQFQSLSGGTAQTGQATISFKFLKPQEVKIQR